MSLENSLTNCPLCNCVLNDTVNRLIKEFCGHLKCRACLHKENNGCQLCYELKEKDDGTKSINAIKSVSEDQNIVYHVIENSAASDYGESSSDKLQIDTESSEDNITFKFNDLSSKTKNNLAISKKFNNKSKKDKASRRSKSLYSHILTISKSDGTYFECSICKKKFTSRGHRHYHLFCANVDKPLSCEICSKQFITKFHYNYHIETHQKNYKFKCPKCDKSYLSSNSLRKHSKKHSDSIEWKHFVCSDCGARFHSSSLLKLHEDTHKNIYPFKCDKCDRKFTLKSNMQNHLVVHLKEKNFACDLCGKKFARKGALKLHSSSHSDERPYKCKHCNKTFTHQRIYSRHLTIHLGKKTFNCPFCDAKCSRKDNFYRHLRNLHPNSNYKEIDKDLIQSDWVNENISDSKEESAENERLGDDTSDEVSDNFDIENIRVNEMKFPLNLNNITHKSLSDGPNSINVIQSIGNVKPISLLNLTENENKLQRLSPTGLPEYRSEIAKEISQITNQINSTPKKRIINGTKPRKPYDPIEIYRKILMPNELDEEDDEQKTSNLIESAFNEINQKEQDITKDILQKPPPIDFSEIHWRKRTSQYFAMK